MKRRASATARLRRALLLLYLCWLLATGPQQLPRELGAPPRRRAGRLAFAPVRARREDGAGPRPRAARRR